MINNNLRVEDVAYAAGFIDGEGCITICQNTKRSYSVLLSVCNTNLTVLQWLQGKFGGWIGGHGNPINARHKPQFRWLVTAKSACEVIRAVQPFLKIKKEQAEAVLSLQELIESTRHTLSGTLRGTKRISEEQLNLRKQLKDKITTLNQRGIPIWQ